MPNQRYNLLFLSVLACTNGCLIPEGTVPVTHLRAEISSQYNHRGMVQNERGVAQGELAIDLADRFGGTVQLSAWNNLDLGDRVGSAWFPSGNGGKVTEVDLTAAYARAFGPLDLRGGLISYVLPEGSEFPNGVRGTTTEVFAVAGGNVLGFYPTLRLDVDWDEVDGFYLNGAVQRSMPLPAIETLRTVLKVSLGYSDDNHSEWTYGVDEAGFADLRGQGTVLYDVNANTTLSVGLAASTMIDDEMRDWFDLIGIKPDNIWVFAGVGWQF